MKGITVYAIIHGKPGAGFNVGAYYISECDGDRYEVGTSNIHGDGGKSRMNLVPSKLFYIEL